MPKLISGAEIVFKALEDQKVEYINAVRKPIKVLNRDYRNYNWEPGRQRGPYGSHDGYADALESGINILNRENNAQLSKWIDSEIEVMFGMQQADGIIEGWHGDGNFARTALCMGYGKLKVRECRHGTTNCVWGLSPPRGALILFSPQKRNGMANYFLIKSDTKIF